MRKMNRYSLGLVLALGCLAGSANAQFKNGSQATELHLPTLSQRSSLRSSKCLLAPRSATTRPSGPSCSRSLHLPVIRFAGQTKSDPNSDRFEHPWSLATSETTQSVPCEAQRLQSWSEPNEQGSKLLG